MDVEMDTKCHNGGGESKQTNSATGKKSNEPGTQTGAAGQSDKIQLRRSVNLFTGISIILGVIIGSGIFVSPKGVLEQSGSIGASLIIWTLCGVLAMLGALCFAELGTSVATSGGEYTYIKLAYGPLPSFLYLWVTVIIIIPCGNAISALTFAKYVLQPIFPGCEPPENAVRLLSLAILFLLVYVNCVSIDASIKVQNSFTLGKVLALVLIVAYGFYWMLTGRADNFKSSEAIWANTQTSLPNLAQAFYAGFYTYSGWNVLNCVSEEIKNPAKSMPRAIIISITTITLVYIMANVAYFAVLSRAEMLESEAIAVTFGEKALSFATWLMPLSVALSTMGGLNGNIFATSRILLAGAREGQLFSAFNMINVNKLTPIPSLIFLGIVSSLYLFTTEILVLINYVVFVEASLATLGVSTLLRLRYKFPDIDRPLRIYTIVPLLYLSFSLLLIILPIWNSPVESAIGIVILLSGIPAYYLTAHWESKPEWYQKSLDNFNSRVQKLTYCVTPSSDVDLTFS